MMDWFARSERSFGAQPLLDFIGSQSRSTPTIAWLALAAAIVCGIALRLAHHDDVTTRSPDERIYTYRAQRIVAEGMGVMRPLFKDYVGNSANWIQSPVTRIGNVWALAAVMKITGARDFSAGTSVSLVCSILSLLLVAWIGVRFFNPWAAAGAVAFQAFSVGALGIARRAWQDSFFGFLSLLILYLTFEITRSPRRFFLYPLFLLVGTYAMLTKETSVISYGVCGLWLFGLLVWKERGWKGACLLALGGLASVAIAAGVWTILAGSASVALSVFRDVKVTSDWGRLNSGGPWWQLAYLLWIVGPLTASMALAGIVATMCSAGARARFGIEKEIGDVGDARLAALIVVSFVLFASLVGDLQYLRILSPADSAYCLLAGLGLWSLLGMARHFLAENDFKALVLLAVLAVGIEAVRDYRIYTSVVVRSGMEDLTAIWIRGILGR
jgi:4-amino-4-deoxy-L-arabinose transferase-like glycosyltransferase